MTTGGDWNGTLNIQLSVPGIGAGAIPQGGNLQSPAINAMANHLRTIAADSANQGNTIGTALKNVGIKFNLAAILKQSQIFTSTLGSLFQIFGAMADIFLAAFMPILVPALRWIASMLPEWRKMIDNSFGKLIPLVMWIADKFKAGKDDVNNWLRAVMPDFMADAITDSGATVIAAGAAVGTGVAAVGTRMPEGFKMDKQTASRWGKMGSRLRGAMGAWYGLDLFRGEDAGWRSAPEAALGTAGTAAGLIGMKRGSQAWQMAALGSVIGAAIVDEMGEQFWDKATAPVNINVNQQTGEAKANRNGEDYSYQNP